MDCPDDPDATIQLTNSLTESKYHFMVGTCDTVTAIFDEDGSNCVADDDIDYKKFSIKVNASS
jgi:hypothetical protein